MASDRERSTSRGSITEMNNSMPNTPEVRNDSIVEEFMSCLKQLKSEQSEQISKALETQKKIDKLENMVKFASWSNTSTNPLNTNSEIIEPPREKNLPQSKAVFEAIRQQMIEEKWLREIKVLKSPYYPQLGDHIVYFRQGYEEYLAAVKKDQLYHVSELDFPWNLMDIKAEEYVKVIDITYELHPPRVCCLKLKRINEDPLTNEIFNVKYHDLEGVVDFLVLKQTFDRTLERNWRKGDKFRCLVSDRWFFGHVESTAPFDVQFPDSQFKRICVKWDDDNEEEKLSPWELESINELRVPLDDRDTAPLRTDEVQIFSYRLTNTEWPPEGRETFCHNILRYLDKLTELQIVKPFINLNTEFNYMEVMKYPIDLATIKARLLNNFYRRLSALEFDIKQFAMNIEEIKEKAIEIDCLSRRMRMDLFTSEKYKLITDIISRIIKDPKEEAINSMLENLNNIEDFSDMNDNQTESSFVPSQASENHSQSLSSQHIALSTPAIPWKISCQKLLNTLWDNKNSIPFREPVDDLDYPDYRRVITNPICLQEIKESLVEGDYKTPVAFSKDMDLMFKNSKKYTPDTRTTIYKQTTKLQQLYKEPMESILSSWRQTRSKKKSSNSTADSINGMSSDNDEEESESDADSLPKRRRRHANIDDAGPSRVRKPSIRFGNAYFKNLDNSDDSDRSVYVDDNISNAANRKRTIKSKMSGDKRKRKRSRILIRENEVEDEDEDDGDSTDNVNDDDEDENSSMSDETNNDDSSESDSSSDEDQDNNQRRRISKTNNTSLSFTSSEELQAVRPDQIVNITGVVSKVDKIREIYSRNTHTDLELFKFIVDNKNGIKVDCIAWEMDAKRYEGKIKRRQIIRIEKAVARDASNYNRGNVNYELAIRYHTKVSVSQ